MSELNGLEDLVNITLEEYNKRLIRLEKLVRNYSEHLVEWADSIKHRRSIKEVAFKYLDVVGDSSYHKFDYTSQDIGTAIIRGLIKPSVWANVMQDRKSLFVRTCIIASCSDSFLFSKEAEALLLLKNIHNRQMIEVYLNFERTSRAIERVSVFICD